jgi:deoxyribodipyrimidine photolyase-related protein
MTRPAWFVGPWDLNRRLACVPPEPGAGTVVLVESMAKGSALPYHRKKLVLVLSAMRHFAEELAAEGFEVEIVRAPSYVEGLRRHVAARGSSCVHALLPREHGLQRALEQADLGVPLHLHDDGGPGGHFLLPRAEVLAWMRQARARSRQGQLRMDTFYRWMRERTGLLMDAQGPLGGRWSLDVENRRAVPKGTRPPAVPSHPPDAVTAAVMARVARWPGHWGEVDGFDWPVTRAGALAELEHFCAHRLASFGDFQDALVDGEPWLWHARLSTALNLGLLHPAELVEAALGALQAGRAPLNAVEGFVRQVIGWREFIRGVYWVQMPELRDANLLGADRPLPDFYWQPERTQMRCVQQAVQAVQQHGYAHHIQRLMVLGNLAMLLGVRPIEISHWFWAGFVDAYEWVELPNVHGMAVYADDTFTTKPYAASGNYLHKMGDHCGRCRYRVAQKHGPDACPFNPLFWGFMVKHRERLSNNVRLAQLYATWDRKSEADRIATLASAEAFLSTLRPAEHGWSFDDDAC